MNVSKSLLFLALASVSHAAIAAGADEAVPEPAAFVQKAALDGMTEVEAGKVALEKSSDPSVRSFAERMVADHGKANKELAAIAKAKGLDVPEALDAEHQAMVDALSAKSGPEFDREYSKHMNMDHSKAVSLFEAASKTADMEIAGFAKRTLPTLKQHRQLAEKLPGKAGTPAGG
ncbi:MAG: hypothetical protein K0Q92_943 [Steroidobacteraceae bacterium]|jgi:putative membrane protein|nr:hypothetical protein [Steroidobacteraceae bacterium]